MAKDFAKRFRLFWKREFWAIVLSNSAKANKRSLLPFSISSETPQTRLNVPMFGRSDCVESTNSPRQLAIVVEVANWRNRIQWPAYWHNWSMIINNLWSIISGNSNFGCQLTGLGLNLVRRELLKFLCNARNNDRARQLLVLWIFCVWIFCEFRIVARLAKFPIFPI